MSASPVAPAHEIAGRPNQFQTQGLSRLRMKQRALAANLKSQPPPPGFLSHPPPHPLLSPTPHISVPQSTKSTPYTPLPPISDLEMDQGSGGQEGETGTHVPSSRTPQRKEQRVAPEPSSPLPAEATTAEHTAARGFNEWNTSEEEEEEEEKEEEKGRGETVPAEVSLAPPSPDPGSARPYGYGYEECAEFIEGGARMVEEDLPGARVLCPNTGPLEVVLPSQGGLLTEIDIGMGAAESGLDDIGGSKSSAALASAPGQPSASVKFKHTATQTDDLPYPGPSAGISPHPSFSVSKALELLERDPSRTSIQEALLLTAAAETILAAQERVEASKVPLMDLGARMGALPPSSLAPRPWVVAEEPATPDTAKPPAAIITKAAPRPLRLGAGPPSEPQEEAEPTLSLPIVAERTPVASQVGSGSAADGQITAKFTPSPLAMAPSLITPAPASLKTAGAVSLAAKAEAVHRRNVELEHDWAHGEGLHLMGGPEGADRVRIEETEDELLILAPNSGGTEREREAADEEGEDRGGGPMFRVRHPIGTDPITGGNVVLEGTQVAANTPSPDFAKAAALMTLVASSSPAGTRAQVPFPLSGAPFSGGFLTPGGHNNYLSEGDERDPVLPGGPLSMDREQVAPQQWKRAQYGPGHPSGARTHPNVSPLGFRGGSADEWESLGLTSDGPPSREREGAVARASRVSPADHRPLTTRRSRRESGASLLGSMFEKGRGVSELRSTSPRDDDVFSGPILGVGMQNQGQAPPAVPSSNHNDEDGGYDGTDAMMPKVDGAGPAFAPTALRDPARSSRGVNQLPIANNTLSSVGSVALVAPHNSLAVTGSDARPVQMPRVPGAALVEGSRPPAVRRTAASFSQINRSESSRRNFDEKLQMVVMERSMADAGGMGGGAAEPSAAASSSSALGASMMEAGRLPVSSGGLPTVPETPAPGSSNTPPGGNSSGSTNEGSKVRSGAAGTDASGASSVATKRSPARIFYQPPTPVDGTGTPSPGVLSASFPRAPGDIPVSPKLFTYIPPGASITPEASGSAASPANERSPSLRQVTAGDGFVSTQRASTVLSSPASPATEEKKQKKPSVFRRLFPGGKKQDVNGAGGVVGQGNAPPTSPMAQQPAMLGNGSGQDQEIVFVQPPALLVPPQDRGALPVYYTSSGSVAVEGEAVEGAARSESTQLSDRFVTATQVPPAIALDESQETTASTSDPGTGTEHGKARVQGSSTVRQHVRFKTETA